MIDSVLNLLFRCAHRRLTRPVTPVSKAGVPHGGTYVVCLDCGKQFSYDLKAMRIGKAIDHSHDASVVPPGLPVPRKARLKYALWAAVPLAFVAGALAKPRRRAEPSPEDKPPAGPGKRNS